jgi:hypothetical protein
LVRDLQGRTYTQGNRGPHCRGRSAAAAGTEHFGRIFE